MSLHPSVFVNWPEKRWAKWLTRELEEGRLRQGWGGVGTSLLNRQRRPRPFDEWKVSYVACSNHAEPEHLTDESVRGRYSIIKTLLEPTAGDIIVFPHIPSTGIFTTVTVTSGYEFDESHFELENLEAFHHWEDGSVPGRPRADAGHVLRVDPKTAKTHGFHDSERSRVIARRFRFYRRCINAVRDREYARLIIQAHMGT